MGCFESSSPTKLALNNECFYLRNNYVSGSLQELGHLIFIQIWIFDQHDHNIFFLALPVQDL